MNKKCRTANIGFAKWRFSASYDSFVVAQTLVLRMKTCLAAGKFVVKIANFL
jgi:hypothetical protein